MSVVKRKANMALDTMAQYHSIVTWETGHVRAAVLELGEGAAEMMGVAAAPIHGVGRTSHPDVDRWFAGCDRALTQAEDTTEISAGRKLVPDYVTMSVPVEITRSLPVMVSHQRRDADTGLTLDELRKLLQRGYRKAQDVVGTHLKDASEDIIYGSLAELTLDGQTVVDPLGLHGENLELHLSFCLAPLEWIRALEVVAERLQLTLTAIIPQHVAYAAPLPDAAALLVLLDEHHTSINLVRYGHVEWSALAEIGEREMSSATAEALGLRGRQADALMRAYRARQLREDVELQLARSFWVELRKWMMALAHSVKFVAPTTPLPHQIYFHDATRRIPEAQQALQTPFWEQHLRFARCPEVVALSINTVRDVLDVSAQASGAAYLSLRTLAHYVARLYGPGNGLDRMLVEAMRWRRPATSARSR
jgi:hypothetical protein